MGAAPGLMLPSLPQVASHHIAQREHNHHQHQHQHQHQHTHLHRRQDTAAETSAEVTQVQTVSVIQEIDVDSNGSTFSTFLTPVPTPTGSSSPILTSSSSTAFGGDDAASSTGATAPGQSPLILSSTASLTSTPSASIPTTTPTFASFLVTSNSTTLISGSVTGSLSKSHFLNATSILSSNSKSSLTYLTSSSTSTTGSTSSTFTSSYSSSPTPTSTDSGAVIVGGGTAAATSAAASSTSDPTDGSNKPSSGSAPTTPVIIGSVVSSIAGAAVIILVLLFLWRWRKRTRIMLPLGSRGNIGEGPGTGPEAIHEPPPPQQPSGNNMVERRSFAYAFPAALANLAGYKRSSQRTETGTISSTAGSERGFYRISGRKLPSVLQSGGDGYGDEIEDKTAVHGRNTLSGTSFYSDSQGFYGGPGSPALPPLGKPMRDSGIPIMRPSPARTPVTEQGFFTTVPLQPPATNPDLIGRSHPSRDGSHASKFTEEV